MGRKILLIIFAFLLLAGCGRQPQDALVEEFEVMNVENTGEQVSLTDVDFVLVPDEKYYILMEELLSREGRVLTRRFIEYDGERQSITEVLRESDLPRSFQQTGDAKDWLKYNAPARLALFPHTYINGNVMLQWEQEGYDYTLENESLVTLDFLKRLGAVSRISEVFIIEHKPEALSQLIKDTENNFLPEHTNLSVRREEDALQYSYAYSLEASLHELPLPGRSRVNTEATVTLFYRVDELGNPLELTMETIFESDGDNAAPLADTAERLAAFTLSMREALISQLGLEGVNANNPALRYANVTLNYGSVSRDSYFSEVYTIQ